MMMIYTMYNLINLCKNIWLSNTDVTLHSKMAQTWTACLKDGDANHYATSPPYPLPHVIALGSVIVERLLDVQEVLDLIPNEVGPKTLKW